MFWNKKTILLVSMLALALVVEVANADFTFGNPANLGPMVNSSSTEHNPNLSADGLELYFWSDRPGGYGDRDIWVTTRATTDDPWGAAVNLGPAVNTPYRDSMPSISADGLSLFFDSERPGSHGGSDIYVTTRATKDDSWGEPVNLGSTVNSVYDEKAPSISADGLALYMHADPPGGYGDRDIWVTSRATTDKPWESPVNLGPVVNTSANEMVPCISADGLALFFNSPNRLGGLGGHDIWVARRAATDDPWAEPANLGTPVNGTDHDATPFISSDGFTLLFSSTRPGGHGGFDLLEVPIGPVVDLNGDGAVDADDVQIMIDHWGTNEPLCDIGPTPWGDGIVDVQDLVVLTQHMEPMDRTLVAHWTLDETEGSIANDSVSGNADIVMGGAIWQPTGGKVSGALELDGADDCIIASFGLDPADGPFSVFAWIKGGGPGQVIISEPMGSNLLMADAEGKLMTELASADGTPLVSEAVITGGQWHRIGVVWDGSQRMLCADGVIVAEDTQNGLETFGTGLYIGVGNDYGAGTFFSGLIDDVRFYNRVVSP